MYSSNQNIVSRSFVSFKIILITHVHAEISQNVWSWKFGLKPWKSPENPLVNMCMNPDIYIYCVYWCTKCESFLWWLWHSSVSLVYFAFEVEHLFSRVVCSPCVDI